VNGLSGHRQEIGDPSSCFGMWRKLFGISKKWEKQEDVNGEEKKCRDETGKQFEASLALRGL